jgi:hypothetical protein
LILSRKDGSIIKTTGFDSTQKRARAPSSVPLQPHEAAAQDEETNSVEKSEAEPRKLLPEEDLAASVFRFMEVAAALGTTMTSVAENQRVVETGQLRSSDATVTDAQPEGSPEDSDTRRAESQVQLLRLRVKGQREIIIFPDPKYICCVVQRVGQQVGGALR